MFNVLKDKLGNILNPIIPRYDLLRYNLKDNTGVKTGRKVNGKDEYVMRFTISSLPNNTTTQFQTGIKNATYVMHHPKFFDGIVWIDLPYAGTRIVFRVKNDCSYVEVSTDSDRHTLNAIVDIYYTLN